MKTKTPYKHSAEHTMFYFSGRAVTFPLETWAADNKGKKEVTAAFFYKAMQGLVREYRWNWN